VNDPQKSWQRLVAAARQAPPPAGDEAAPYGFATRVAALAFARPDPGPSIFARYSLRAAAVAGLLALAAVAANYTAIKGAFDDEGAPVNPTDDPVAEVVDLAS
jgi:hypothetical protein